MLNDLVERFRPVGEQDKLALMDLIGRHTEEMAELIDAITARPLTAERVNPRRLTKPWKDLAPYTAFKGSNLKPMNGKG
jgi:hypothetical protein